MNETIITIKFTPATEAQQELFNRMSTAFMLALETSVEKFHKKNKINITIKNHGK